MKLLFVCSKNQWRSPTAEDLYRDCPGLLVRSRGTASSARRKVSASDLNWADLILVMESKHKQRLREDFERILRHTEIHVLDIPDRYRRGDPELIEQIRGAVDPLLSST